MGSIDRVGQRFVTDPNKEAVTQDECGKRQPTGQGRESVNQRIGTREGPEVTRRQLAGSVQFKLFGSSRRGPARGEEMRRRITLTTP